MNEFIRRKVNIIGTEYMYVYNYLYDKYTRIVNRYLRWNLIAYFVLLSVKVSD